MQKKKWSNWFNLLCRKKRQTNFCRTNWNSSDFQPGPAETIHLVCSGPALNWSHCQVGTTTQSTPLSLWLPAKNTFSYLSEEEKNFIVYKTIFFTLGFSFVFIALGSTASFIGKFFLINSNILRILAGSIIVLFSLQLIGLINFSFMNKELRFFTNRYSNNIAFPFMVGAAFGFGWTPCIGPILGSILALAAIENNFLKGIYLLSFYSLGLAIPFIISGILINKFLFFFQKS